MSTTLMIDEKDLPHSGRHPMSDKLRCRMWFVTLATLAPVAVVPRAHAASFLGCDLGERRRESQNAKTLIALGAKVALF
jgi:hypothetical protein